MKRNWTLLAAVFAVVLFVLGLSLSLSAQAAPGKVDIQFLGEKIYFDTNLSEPDGMECAACHMPRTGFDDPDDALPVSEGVVPGLFGGRNSPISAYAMYSPFFGLNEEGLYFGGLFWDGRATGYALGDPLADQAMGPFMNPVEMHNAAKYEVVRDVAMSPYRMLFASVWGYTQEQMAAFAGATSDTPEVILAYDRVALSIAAYERSNTFAAFNSKYDIYLKVCMKLGGLPDECAVGVGPAAEIAGRLFSTSEWNGLLLFVGLNNNDGILEEGEGANCALCHTMEWTLAADYALEVISPDWAPDGLVPPVFSDHTYDNLGLPVNPEIAALIGAPQPIDLGLGGVLGIPAEYGKFRVVSLRDIGVSGPYGHNGYFKTLYDVVHYYNIRDVSSTFPPPEVPETVNREELGNLGLTYDQEMDLVNFMNTLTDHYAKR